ncbi:MAG: serine/threonine protein kinase, partial [Deltaproteobacteria bacterium]
MERRIDDYRVISQLGRGVMGEVLQAVDVETGKEVALQTLLPITPLPEGTMREIKSRFVQETRLLSRLGHPHIVPITLPEEMSRRSTDPLYYVMPYIPGNLSQIFGESSGATPITLSLTQAVRVILPLLDALDAIHQRGIIHRDIKPVNVLFQGDHIYLTNFSLPRPWGGAPPRRIESWPPTFQAPEVITRQQTIDGRADIYSIGALLYRMLIGRIPRCPTV